MLLFLQQAEIAELAIYLTLIVLLLSLLFVFRQNLKQNHQISQISAMLELASSSQNSALIQLFDKQQLQLSSAFDQQMADLRLKLLRELGSQKDQLNQTLSQNQNQTLDQLISHLNKTTQANREELSKSLIQSSEQMTKRIDVLTNATDKRLQEISGQVEKRLAEGFEKTTKTFSDILQRLALIDDAQKKITELSTNVVSLQEVLNDKRSRGAFGEVQLSGLIRNVLPEQSFKLQHTLSNGKIADCVLFLPEPTGNVVVDAKFPLESYRKMMDFELAESDRKTAQRQFKVDIKKHINDISDKYLIDKETADGAIMFIPAEAIFAEIHGHQSDLVDYANKKRVWLASPTTLMAILTTARSVLKDEATRKQVHIIQAHLSDLAKDFDRFKGRFANLAKHIDQAAVDVRQIHTSADKITNRFEKIEQVELQDSENNLIEKS
ncbi:DNA recombination protein RmuC [Colwellia sp. 20A7]|uniref:DNA recombination protein RmuC n=1 Tax=Colwellia sp. 20A7 TaxID=2689569 RepID=UPI001358A659|nr:DNA recombination protein RmuC [Colwellia sp. 20A7]